MWAVYLEYQISVLIIFKWIYLLEAFIHFSQCCTVIVWSLYWYLILNKSAILFFDANECTILFSFCKTISWCIVMFLCMHEKLQFWSCCWQKPCCISQICYISGFLFTILWGVRIYWWSQNNKVVNEQTWRGYAWRWSKERRNEETLRCVKCTKWTDII